MCLCISNMIHFGLFHFSYFLLLKVFNSIECLQIRSMFDFSIVDKRNQGCRIWENDCCSGGYSSTYPKWCVSFLHGLVLFLFNLLSYWDKRWGLVFEAWVIFFLSFNVLHLLYLICVLLCYLHDVNVLSFWFYIIWFIIIEFSSALNQLNALWIVLIRLSTLIRVNYIDIFISILSLSVKGQNIKIPYQQHTSKFAIIAIDSHLNTCPQLCC